MTTPRLLALALCAALATFAHADDAKPAAQPPLSEQTVRSGGAMPAEQARLHFDHAELHFNVDIDQQSLDATARLTFSAREATDVLVQPKTGHIEIRDWSAY